MKYVSLVLLGLLMAVLAGCGGGGDDGVARTLEEDLALVQADLEAAQSELATTKADLEAREAELTTAQADLATAQSELATTKETLSTTKETLSTTQDDLVEANADLETKESELATTKADLMTTETELDTAEDQLTTARINLATATANLANAQTNLMTAQADLTTAETDLEEKTSELTTTQAELATAKANLTAEQSDLLEAQAALKTAQDALAAETTKLLTAQADLKTAQDTLETVRGTLTTTQSALTTARTRVTTLEDQVTTLQGQVTTLTNQVASLRGQVQTGNTNLQTQLSDAEQATVDARAEAYLTAIRAGTLRSNVTVTYDRGSSLMINPGGNFTTGSGAPSISGFSARTYKRQVGASGEQTVYLYTNIQAPGGRDFWKIHGPTVAGAQGHDNVNPTPTGAASFIPHATNRALSAGVRVSGTYDGVSGTYECVAVTNCAGTRTSITLTGLVTDRDPVTRMRSFAGNQEWTFKPGSITSDVRQARDTEHIYFGIWVEEPNVASAAHDYEYIVGGASTTYSDRLPTTENMVISSIGGLTDTATFRGGAVGKYVTRNQVGENASIGTFRAEANFTATFGANPALEGRLTNFRDGSRSLTGWHVHLGGEDNEMPSNEPAEFANGTVMADAVASGSHRRRAGHRRVERNPVRNVEPRPGGIVSVRR